ncbi:hypothetical protein PG999_013282 [Apiospora kogelbergensis]|uniref:Endonuclease/exonuclease/phosphatase domain-containing protein n=1 Tax=Apiospora kogelbergensis TaxID=1337665 RepID=A0AAW0QF02_9PEZI
MAPLFRDPKVLEYDIIAIQEPWISKIEYNSHNPRAQAFILWLPTQGAKPPGVAFFINKRLDQSRISFTSHSANIATVAITYDTYDTNDTGPAGTNLLHVYNVYNNPPEDQPTSTLRELDAIYTNTRDAHSRSDHVIVGDFNMEGPEWAAEDLGDRGSARQGLPYFRDFLRTKSLQVVLPEGTITREEGDSASTIDLAICNTTAASKLLKCRRADEIHHDSDHWPISTTIQLRTIKAADTSPTKLWKNTPVDVFRARLAARLPTLQGRPSDQDVVDTFQKVVAALQDTIEDTVPIANPTIRHTPGFTGACKEKCRETNRLRKVWQHTRTPGAWEAYRKVRNQKATVAKKALTENWQEKVNRASAEGPKGLWGLVKMTKTRGQGAAQQNVTPTINNETKFDGKVAALSRAFFPAPPDIPKTPSPPTDL